MERVATTWLRPSESINIQKREIKRGGGGSSGRGRREKNERKKREEEEEETVSKYVVARIYVSVETRSTAALDSSLHVIQMSFWSPAPPPPTR